MSTTDADESDDSATSALTVPDSATESCDSGGTASWSNDLVPPHAWQRGARPRRATSPDPRRRLVRAASDGAQSAFAAESAALRRSDPGGAALRSDGTPARGRQHGGGARTPSPDAVGRAASARQYGGAANQSLSSGRHSHGAHQRHHHQHHHGSHSGGSHGHHSGGSHGGHHHHQHHRSPHHSSHSSAHHRSPHHRSPGQHHGHHHHHHNHHNHQGHHHGKHHHRMGGHRFSAVLTHHFDSTYEASVRLEQADHDRIDPNNFPVFDPDSFRPYPWATYVRDRKQVVNELLCGVTIAFAQIPESVAFAFVAGLSPAQGLHAAWMVGLVSALFGSRPGLIAGATPAHAAVLAPALVGENGLARLPFIVMLSGLMSVMCAALGVAKFVRLIPITSMQGFLNAIAIVMALAQVHAFEASEFQYPGSDHAWLWAYEPAGGWATVILMVVLICVTWGVVHFLPRVSKSVPAAFVALGVATALEFFWRAVSGADGVATPLLGEFADIGGGLPKPFFMALDRLPTFDWPFFVSLLLPAIEFTAVGLIEGLITMEVLRDQTETPNLNPNQMLLVVGIANLVAGFFNTMGGGAVIGLSVLAVHTGANGRYRLSGVVCALAVFVVIAALDVVIGVVPVAALVGIIVVVVIHTFNWGSLYIIWSSFLPDQLRQRWGDSLRMHHKIDRIDATAIVLVTVLSVWQDLFIGVAAGVVLSALKFAWSSSHKLTVDDELIVDRRTKLTKKVYVINGPLFFGTVTPLMHFFHPSLDPDEVEIHLQRTQIFDYSAIDALNELGAKYKALGKGLHVRNLNISSLKLVAKVRHRVQHFSYTVDESVDDAEEPLDAPLGLNVAGHGLFHAEDGVQ